MSPEHVLQSPVDESVLARVTSNVARYPLVWFFALAFACSWTLSIQYLVTRSGPMILNCGPFLAAITVLGLTTGRNGVKALFRSMVKWRVGARWWAIALLLPVVITAAAVGLNLTLGEPSPTSHDLSRWTNVLPVFALVLLVPVIGGAWEEPGWRGYASGRVGCF
jgi:uncharacterized protein